MKSFWGAGESLSAIAASVKSGAAAVTAQVSSVPDKSSAPQFLRLPLESARRLRWYDSKDLDAIVREHTKDKQMLFDCVTALRACMVDRGINEDELDLDVQMHLADVEKVRSLDEAVNSALLVSAQAELDRLKALCAEHEAQLVAVGRQLSASAPPSAAASAGGDPPPSDVSHAASEASLERGRREGGSPRAASPPPRPPSTPALPSAAASSSGHPSAQQGQQHSASSASAAVVTDVVRDRVRLLGRLAEEYRNACNRALAVNNATLSTERAAAAQERAGSMRLLMTDRMHLERLSSVSERASVASSDCTPTRASAATGSGEQAGVWGDGVADDASLLQQLEGERAHVKALMGKLKRLEAERQSTMEEVTDLYVRLSQLPIVEQERDEACRREESLRTLVEHLQEQLGRQGERESGGGSAPRAAAAELAAVSKQLDMARHAHKAMQQRSLEESDRAERLALRCEKAEARCQRFEGEAREAQRRVKSLEVQVAALQRDLAAAAARASGAEASLADAQKQVADVQAARAAAGKNGGAATDGVTGKGAAGGGGAPQQRLMEQLRSAHADIERLQRAAAAAEERGAALQEALQDYDRVASERDELAAKLDAAAAQLRDARGDQSRIAHFRQVASEMEDKAAGLEEQLVAAARIITALEARVADLSDHAAAADDAARRAAEAAADAEARVADEVALRLSCVGSDRAAWPAAARSEVEVLEARVAVLAAAAAAADAERGAAAHGAAERDAALRAATARAEAAERELAAAAAEAQLRTAALERQQRQAEAEVAACHAKLRRLEGEARAPSASGSEWEVIPLRSGNGAADRPRGVDMLYLKNVVFKFVEAVARGRAAERDSLLPVVVMLLGAAPAESGQLKSMLTSSGPSGLFTFVS